jgi:hypothetical protein
MTVVGRAWPGAELRVLAAKATTFQLLPESF